MTTIKPPDGRNPADRLGSTGATPHAPVGEGPSFREVLGPASSEGATSTEVGAAASSATDPAALAQAVRAGALTPDQALDRLVERAVAGAGGGLSAAQQGELRSVLREALQADPALRELRDALG
jgi:hypothetical protein